MKRLLPVLIFLFASFNSHAQNWNPLNPGATNYFVNNYGYVRAMRIDSLVAYGNQLHYYPYRREHIDRWGYYVWGQGYPQNIVGSWLGKDVTRNMDGTFLFPNHWSDTIKIKTQASVGDTWTFYQGTDSVYYVAELTALDTMTVLGLVDSIRKITLFAFANGNAIASDSFDHAEIILSKTHGFYSIMDLYFFPFHAPGSDLPHEDYYTVNSLRAHTEWQDWDFELPGKYGCTFTIFKYIDPTPAQLSDWEVGDVCEYGACYPNVFPSAQCWIPYTTRFDSIISKTVYSNGIEYVRKGWTALPHYDSFSTTILSYSIAPHQDTGFAPSAGSGFHEMFLPEESPSIWGDARWVYYYVPDDTAVCETAPAYYKLKYSRGLSSNEYKAKFKLGIGQINWESSEYFDGSTMNNYGRLTYAVRGGVACGSYYFPDTTTEVPNAIVNVNEGTSVKMYPNPASGQLTIETSMSNYQLSLVNVTGQVVYRREACNRKQVIDVEGLANGVYNLKLETVQHEVIYRKVVIQN